MYYCRLHASSITVSISQNNFSQKDDNVCSIWQRIANCVHVSVLVIVNIYLKEPNLFTSICLPLLMLDKRILK